MVAVNPGVRYRSTGYLLNWYLSMHTDFTAEEQRAQRNSLTKTIKHFAFLAPLR
jgi:hypothetical protein